MRPRAAILVSGALGAAATAIAALAAPGTPASRLAVLGAAIVAGEQLLLRPSGRTPLPVSYAVVLVLVRSATPLEGVMTLAGAQLVAALVRPSGGTVTDRVLTSARRLAAGLAALGVLHAIVMGPHDTRGRVLVGLMLAGIAMIAVDDLVVLARTRRVAVVGASRAADLAVMASGMLMSIGYEGLGDHAGMGGWGSALFAVPLLGAWYSFERLASIRRTYEQTITALSVVPELAGLARSGHAERVASLVLAVGRELHLDRGQLEYMRAASLLHHLGHLCLDDPVVLGRPVEPGEVADKGAEILRKTGDLAPAGDILAPDSSSVASQVLRVASAFDELTEGDPARAEAAVEALYSGPGYVYDGRVLAALERVVTGRETRRFAALG